MPQKSFVLSTFVLDQVTNGRTPYTTVNNNFVMRHNLRIKSLIGLREMAIISVCYEKALFQVLRTLLRQSGNLSSKKFKYITLQSGDRLLSYNLLTNFCAIAISEDFFYSDFGENNL